jgi:raffinose/stachyose/melibiose transport system substrate-binding protein
MTIRANPMPSGRQTLASRARVWPLAVCVLGVVVAACSPPSGQGTVDAESPQATKSVAVASGPLRLLVSTPDVPLYEKLADEFEAENPKAQVTIESEDFGTLITNAPRILSTSNPPDIIKLASFGNLVKDRMILDLDPYAEAYGWDEWPQSQFASARVADDGRTRGTGSLYGVGPGFGLTGVYYNRAFAEQIGMTSPPATLGDFENLLARARESGLLPIMANGKDGGTAFLLQNLQMDYAGGGSEMQAWTFNQPDADIDTAATVRAADTLQSWAEQGNLPEDVNSIDQTIAPSRFMDGEGVFFPSGNWQAPGLDQDDDTFGFFLFPPLREGDRHMAMTAGSNLAIASRSPHQQTAAAFLNFVQTNESARGHTVSIGGLIPAGPADAPVPPTEKGSVVGDTVAAFQELVASDGLVDFMANATASIQVSTIVPATQSLVAGRLSPEAFAEQLQAGYEREVQR